jgi:DNA segregation ATPase FtsK/SpoIIIE-like protein
LNTHPANDLLLPVARQLVVQLQNPSVAFLQRMLKLPYRQTVELMQGLEGDLVSTPDAAGWRHLLVNGSRSPDAPPVLGHTAKDTTNSGNED